MKKLLSICFLSILLGFLNLSVSAQRSTGCSGFWIENLKPAVQDSLVNAPDGSGNLVLSHTMNIARRDSIDLYELHFCPCDLDPKTKVSVDWLLYRDGVLVNDSLSKYADFDIYTLYPELNNAGVCQSIHWLGGRVPNAFGYCDQPVQPDMFSGYSCNTPTNYPGALQVGQGTPGSVLNSLGEYVDAHGQVSLYSESYDFFYLDFFAQTRTVVQIKWKQVGNYSLVMRIRQRNGGTDWSNFYWGGNENNHIGGHQSCCGEIIVQDSLHYLVRKETSKEICAEDAPFHYGRPDHAFYVTTPDTVVCFGDSVGEGACRYFDLDSVVRFHFFARHNPVVQIANHDTTICSCQEYSTELFGVTLDTVDLKFASDTAIQWYQNGVWYEEPTYWDSVWTATDTTFIYIVRQVNTYNYFGDGPHVCEGPEDTLYVRIRAIESPVLSGNYDICLQDIDSNTTVTLVAVPDSNCTNTNKWYADARFIVPGRTDYDATYSDYRTVDIYKDSYKNSYIDTANALTVNLINYIPSTNKDTVLYFFATSYNSETGCESNHYSYTTVTIHQTPALERVTIPDSFNCPGTMVVMSARVSTSDADAPFTFRWTGVESMDINGANVPFVADQETTIGTNTGTTTYVPFNSAARYNYTQQIFMNTEVPSGLISKISFYYKGNAALSKENVNIYLANTEMENFNSSTRVWAPQGQLVFSDTFACSDTGWVELELNTPFNYDGTQNLVLTIQDFSNKAISGGQSFRTSTLTGSTRNKSMYYYGSVKYEDPNDIPNANSGQNKKRTVLASRSDVKFYIESVVPSTMADSTVAYYTIADTAKCEDAFISTVMVIDSNGCKSDPVAFNYIVKDTIAPIVTPDTVRFSLNACTLDSTNTQIYKTLDDLKQANVDVWDNCDSTLLTISQLPDVTNFTDCEKTLIRRYELKDICGLADTLTVIYFARDSVAPEFRRDTTELPYAQLFPVPGGNCTYNSPDSMDFVNAVAPWVYDDCTDSTYLMSTLKFYWENTELSPIGDTNIFRVKNHLTVTATITDRCGNKKKDLVIFLDRPDSMWIEQDVTPLDSICEEVTVTLSFDTLLIHGDANIGLFTPFRYQWREVNGRPVIFGDANAKETTVTPVGHYRKHVDYIFQLTVTDSNDCEAVSGYYVLPVNPIPRIDLVEVPYGGATRPYCPTYGNMTVAVVDDSTGLTIPGLTYTWSGEGVNTTSRLDTSWVTIVPDSCDHDYPVFVVAEDGIGCTAYDTVIVPVRDTEGPIILDGTLRDTTLVPNDSCQFFVPDYKPFLNASNVTSKCGYSPTKIIETYVQTPEAGTKIADNVDTVEITIKLTTPCGTDSLYKVYAFKPDNHVRVYVTVSGDSVCENDPQYNGVTLTAHASQGYAPYTYVWKKGQADDTLNTDLTSNVYVAHDTNGTYTYKVEVMDSHNCPVSDDADLTIYDRGIRPVWTATPNRICEGHNGTLTLPDAPVNYTYIIQGQHKVNDVYEHDGHHDVNTVIFYDLYHGWWPLTYITPDPENCEDTIHVYIPESITHPDTVVATPTAVTNCFDNNGMITLTRESGYTYYMSTNGNIDSNYVVVNETVISGLSSGTYWFKRVNNVTNCESAPSWVYVPRYEYNVEFTVGLTANDFCIDTVGSGTMTLATANMLYTVIYNTYDTLYKNVAPQTINNLLDGDYRIWATDNNGCMGHIDTNITKVTVTPHATITTTPNRYCNEEFANGSITVTNIQPAADYTIFNASGDSVKPANYNSLYGGDYTVELITSKGCDTTYNVTVGDTNIYPVLTIVTDTNSTCKPNEYDGSVTITVTNPGATQAGTAFTYILTNAQLNYADTNTTGKFDSLYSGTYDVAVISSYGCETDTTAEVGQYEVPALDLTAMPNTLCDPTPTKPGNGSITVNAPRNTAEKHYNYVYIDEQGNEMVVYYNEPYVYTKYWLANGFYTVRAYEIETGCIAEDTITVPIDRFNVTIHSEPEGNKFCEQNFDGKITVEATSTNPDAILQYKVEGVDNNYVSEYTFDPVFTGLQNGTYNVIVRDTNTACEYYDSTVVVPLLSNDIAISLVLSPNHACDSLHADGRIIASASTTSFENATFQYKLNDGEYSVDSVWTNLVEGNYTVWAKEMTSGCVVRKDTTLENDNLCTPQIDITAYNNNFYNEDYGFCKGQDNAKLCATATVAEGCEETDFDFVWTIDCHFDTVYNSCVNVNTDDVHCCYYTVKATSRATGCTNYKKVRVCITGAPTPSYTENGNRIRNKEFSECENIDVDVCVDSAWLWISAIWSNSYVTPDDQKPYDTCFTIPANSTIPGRMYSYCVDLIDTNGCPVRDLINFTSKNVDTNYVDITVCENSQEAWINQNLFISRDTNITVPYIAQNGCDSFVVYRYTVLPLPTANFTNLAVLLDSVYCAPQDTLMKVFMRSVEFANAPLNLQILRGTNWVEFDPNTTITYNYVDSTFRFHVANTCGSVDSVFQVHLNQGGIIDTVAMDTLFCASSYNEIAVKVTTFNSDATLKIFLKEHSDVPLATPMTVSGHLTKETFYFNNVFMPMAYDGDTLVVALINACDSIAQELPIDVDTNYINIDTMEYCEGDSVNFAFELARLDATNAKYANDAELWIARQLPTPASAPFDYATPYKYQRGTGLDTLDNGAKVFFKVPADKAPCGELVSDTTMLYVNPLPYFEFDDHNEDVCLEDALEALNYSVTNVRHADSTAWLYFVPGTGDFTRVIWTEDFEYGNDLPYGWTAINNSSDYAPDWIVDDHAIISASWYNHSSYHADNWLFTPAIDVIAGTTLSFDEGAIDPAFLDYYSVYVLDNPDVDLDATPVAGYDSIPSSAVWTKHTINLSAYAGQTVYVAFRHIDYDKLALGLDNITLSINGTLQHAENTAEIVNVAKNVPSVDVYFYASNGCDTLLEKVVTLRVFDTLDLTVSSPLTICPNEKLDANMRVRISPQVERNHYAADDIVVKYYGGNNFATELDPTAGIKLADFLYNGKIMVVATFNDNVYPQCGNDTEYVQLNVLTWDTTNPVIQPACECSPLVDFVETEPDFTSSGISVTAEFWTVRFNNTSLNLPDSVVDDPDHMILCTDAEPSMFYTWITSCNDTIVTDIYELQFYYKPEVDLELDYDTVDYCLGDTLKLADFNLDVTVVDPYNLGALDMDTIWVFGIDTLDVTNMPALTVQDNMKTLYVIVKNDCGAAIDSAVVKVNNPNIPEAEGDATICLEGDVTLTVVNPTVGSTYYWYVEGVEDPIASYIFDGTDSTTNVHFDTLASDPAHTFITPEGGVTVQLNRSEFYYFTVVEMTEFGCLSTSMVNQSSNAFSSDVITVKSTDKPQFRFFDAAGNETHHITDIQTGNETDYTWMIDAECTAKDKLVFVEFSIYRNGELIAPASVGDYFSTYTGTEYSSSKQWISSNMLSWYTTLTMPNSDEHYTRSVTMYYNSSIPGNHTPEDLFSGNHFPNTNLNGQGAADAYESMYLHFLDKRPITAKLVPFRQDGEYTFVYELYSTSNEQIIQNLYYDTNCHCNRIIGAQGSMAGEHTVLTLLVRDSLKFSVEGPNIAPAAQPETQPEIAPELTIDEATVAPEMEVWPNPAPATTTTLKARVHNMAGNANVTLTSLTGKQVYTGTTYIDNDNYYFEFGVNDLSVGSYILTVRTADAVITKKVIITVLAR